MSFADALGTRLTRAYRQFLAFVRDGSLPPRDDLPRYLAPLPELLEDIGYRLVWLVVVINLAGTAFGFYYYSQQFAATPVVMWPFVPDSPMGTLFIALALGLWALGRTNEYANAFALFGCIKLGAWTPYVLLAFFPAWDVWWPMYNFLFWSHCAMVVQAFVLHRIADFPVKAVAAATLWYTVDLTLDYFYNPTGVLTHTTIPVFRYEPWFLDGSVTNLQIAAAGAVVLTVIPLFVALATRVKKLESRQRTH
ncbi:DUF1405 domain-containing protein [Halomarina oriensis]|uniref:DUF1405 domain-containing protein n=1 Tax=Halomarina oriensis TaxID=671145 RepID=A0A6B0GLU5_9EURY|nr:DUF1405 domain-containing protein [Halomarina oriensis]MWG35822.1 DUF1405 domain-containing protein [Halomarina oriensis]